MRTYKKILNYGIASTTALVADNITKGVDSLAIGQTGPSDADVPTGWKIRGVRVQAGFGNQSTTIAMHVGVCIQYRLSGQTATVDPLAQGGHAQRNQVIKSWMFVLAPQEHRNIDTYVKIPKQFQRIKEGMIWTFAHSSAGVTRTYADQLIYKVRE